MKKIVSIVLLIMCVFGFANIKVVSATTIANLNNDDIEKNVENDVIYLKLINTTSENLEIQEGEIVVLDLNGKTLNNTTTSGELTVDLPTIRIAEGGTLTIKGDGSITRTQKYAESQLQQAIIDNYGTLNLNLSENGFISPQVASTYGIYNHLAGILNMTGGRVSTMNKTTYGLWNEGTANISGGRFDQNKYVVGDDYADQPAVVNSPTGKLNITGGDFINMTGYETPTVAPITGSETTVTGGKFEYQDPTTYAVKSQNISNLLPEGYTTDNYGNVIEEPESEPEPTVPEDSENTQEETEPNPNTYDTNIVYMGLALLSLGTVIVSIKKLINN